MTKKVMRGVRRAAGTMELCSFSSAASKSMGCASCSECGPAPLFAGWLQIMWAQLQILWAGDTG